MKLYKFLQTGLRSAYDDSPWQVGVWRKMPAPTKECVGFNGSRYIQDALGYVPGEVLTEVEAGGKIIKEIGKCTCEKMRVIRWASWTKAHSVRLAVYSARLCLNKFEAKYPRDKRPRRAIEVAERYLAKAGGSEGDAEAAQAASEAARAATASAGAPRSATWAAWASWAAWVTSEAAWASWAEWAEGAAESAWAASEAAWAAWAARAAAASVGTPRAAARAARAAEAAWAEEAASEATRSAAGGLGEAAKDNIHNYALSLVTWEGA